MTLAPDLMPVLSRGRHRTPKKGACFMEMASYLAGERWSDHPDCTHPLLAAVARDVNDHASDSARSRIVPLIPDVVGLTSDDPRAYVWIAEEVALAALPIAPFARQRVAAVGLIRCEEVLNELEGRPRHVVSEQVRVALSDVPHARDWASQFITRGRAGSRAFAQRSAPVIVHSAVAGISEAALQQRDDRLIALLEQVVVVCRERFTDRVDVDQPAPAPALV